MRVIGYTRTSTPEQRDAAQEAAIRAECERRGWELVDIVRDGGYSGKTLDRPGLRTVQARIELGEAEGMVAARLDRVARSATGMGQLTGWFEQRGATLVVLDLIDTTSVNGRMVATVLAAVAEWDREIHSTMTREALAVLRAEGKPIGRPAVADRPQLEARIQAMRASGMTLQAIANQLNDERVPTLRGGAEWRPSSVQTATGYRRTAVLSARVLDGAGAPSGAG